MRDSASQRYAPGPAHEHFAKECAAWPAQAACQVPIRSASLLRRCVSGPGTQLAQGGQALLQARHAQLHSGEHDACLRFLAPVHLRGTTGGSVRRRSSSTRLFLTAVRYPCPAPLPRSPLVIHYLAHYNATHFACGVSEQSKPLW